MKKLFTLLLFAFTVSSAMAIKVKQIPLEEFGSGNKNYDKETQTFTPTCAWDGCYVSLGNCSTTGFGNIALELAEASSNDVYFQVTYTDNSTQDATISAGNLKATIKLNTTTEIREIAVKSKGDWVSDQTIKLESIYLFNEEVGTTTNLWKGKTKLGAWENWVQLNNNNFASWNLAKYKLRIAVTPSEDAQILLQNGKWNTIDGTVRYLTDETFVDYQLTDEMLNTIKNNVQYDIALNIKGQNCTVTRVDIISPYVNLADEMDHGWDSSYNTGTKTITFEKAWRPRGWEFAEAKDASDYNVLVCDITASCDGYVYIDYLKDNITTTGDERFEVGSSIVYLVLDDAKKDHIKSIYFKNEHMASGEGVATTITLNDVHFSYGSVKKLSTRYASFSAPYPVTIPEGVAVGIAKVDGNQIVVTYVEDTVIPANTGVILKGTGSCILERTTEQGEPSHFGTDQGNELVATSLYPTPDTGDGNYYYGLLADEAAFAKITGNPTFSGNKAYIKTETQAQQARLVIFDDETTAVQGIENVEATAMGKHLENGRLVIVKNGNKFNAAGQLVK